MDISKRLQFIEDKTLLAFFAESLLSISSKGNLSENENARALVEKASNSLYEAISSIELQEDDFLNNAEKALKEEVSTFLE